MVSLAANLSMLFTEHDFLDRFAHAREAGFRAVEFLFPYDHSPEAVAEAAKEAGVAIVLFNCPPGDWDAGERGTAALPARLSECRAGIDKALSYAKALSCPRLHLMGGVVGSKIDAADAHRTYIDNVRYAADRAAESCRTICIEPLNSRDVPGYIVATTDRAAEIIAEIDRPNVRLQFDFYHAQIMEGDLITRLHRHFNLIGHVQIAGVPDRHEPDLGEIAPHVLLSVLDDIGYSGHVGCEYRPAAGTLAGLGWASDYLTLA
ncbi:2-oxo-tetronate isomerase [Fodinicurvata sp. EGI_FJ10296]|uniref:2-oxo-tetronate isomerase n=1 Tax=Fodinicurvata sp. EGI_FJ10296 TaxID=3231908 RepID=UPI0034560CB7